MKKDKWVIDHILYVLIYSVIIGVIGIIIRSLLFKDTPFIENVYKVLGIVFYFALCVSFPLILMFVLWIISLPIKLFDEIFNQKKKK